MASAPAIRSVLDRSPPYEAPFIRTYPFIHGFKNQQSSWGHCHPARTVSPKVAVYSSTLALPPCGSYPLKWKDSSEQGTIVSRADGQTGRGIREPKIAKCFFCDLAHSSSQMPFNGALL